eukprot:m51a1_g10914 hypothetical protein (554) ;mRNA; r:80181-81842
MSQMSSESSGTEWGEEDMLPDSPEEPQEAPVPVPAMNFGAVTVTASVLRALDRSSIADADPLVVSQSFRDLGQVQTSVFSVKSYAPAACALWALSECYPRLFPEDLAFPFFPEGFLSRQTAEQKHGSELFWKAYAQEFAAAPGPWSMLTQALCALHCDPRKSEGLLLAACNCNALGEFSPALHALAVHVHRPRGNRAVELGLLVRASELQHPGARRDLARLAVAGPVAVGGAAQSSLDLLLFAARQGHPGAALEAAQALKTLGHAEDLMAGMQLLVETSKALYAPGMLEYSEWIDLNGVGLCYNPQLAHGFRTHAATLALPEALYRLGLDYMVGVPHVVGKDLRHALQLIRSAADLRHAPAMTALGECYLYGIGLPTSLQIAVKMFSDARQLGDGRAFELMGHVLRDDHTALYDPAEAFRQFQAASCRGRPGALLELGRMLQQGLGVDRDERLAEGFLWLAAREGQTKACWELWNTYQNRRFSWPNDRALALEALRLGAAAPAIKQKMADLLACGSGPWRQFQDIRLAHRLYSELDAAGESRALGRQFHTKSR